MRYWGKMMKKKEASNRERPWDPDRKQDGEKMLCIDETAEQAHKASAFGEPD